MTTQMMRNRRNVVVLLLVSAVLVLCAATPKAEAYYDMWFCGTAGTGQLLAPGARCPAWNGAGTGVRHSWSFVEVYQNYFTSGVSNTNCEEAWRWQNGFLLSRRCFFTTPQGNGYIDSQSDLNGTYLAVADAWAQNSGFGARYRELHGWARTP